MRDHTQKIIRNFFLKGQGSPALYPIPLVSETRAMIPTSGRRNRESRMPHTSKLWQLEAMTHIPNHDTPP